MATALHQTFRVIISQKGGQKMIEGGYMYGMQRRVNDVTHWQCEQRGVCKARVHTKGMDIVRRTNEHLHAPDEEAVRCYETKVGMKRQALSTTIPGQLPSHSWRMSPHGIRRHRC